MLYNIFQAQDPPLLDTLCGAEHIPVEDADAVRHGRRGTSLGSQETWVLASLYLIPLLSGFPIFLGLGCLVYYNGENNLSLSEGRARDQMISHELVYPHNSILLCSLSGP